MKGSKLFHTTRMLMHPMERLEGGLTQIERRVLHEMALTAGAGKVAIWEGHVLTDNEPPRLSWRPVGLSQGSTVEV